MLELTDIHYDIYEKKKRKRLLEMDHFQLQQGERLGIVGPNGAGKSTLLKIMSLLDQPSAGQIHFLQEQVYPGKIPLALRRKMATVFQRPLLMDTTVYENIAVGLKFRKYQKSAVRERVHEWLDQFNIEHLAQQYAATLSGGEAQRVSLARALVLEPHLLFLDEPFSALDFPTKVAMMEDLRRILQQNEITTVFVSHDLLEVKYMTEKLAVMLDGKIVQIGPTAEVIEHPNASAATFIGQWNQLF